ncbi:carbohydrate-binding domain-containing protein [Catalinimonas niigatensis]|uniref:carbohydrate-binding domain-containing protein n=1 Tax=Catalinimonas niigatensis TaxID=1397264 RepID=UPI002664E5E9|nr:carbohydrate-binding domain-containing protein [Catalinimonas niigatensis]WPP50126.1 carbohydrate-binding domain-containing protein [Catalinimonas niigatensis]
MLKKILFSSIFLVGAVILGRLLAPSWYHFLAVNQPLANAEVLLVEGWVTDRTLKLAAQEFKEKNYKKMVIASIHLPDVYRAHSRGGLVFEIDKALDSIPHFDTLQVYAYGSQANGQYAQMRVIAGNDTLGEVTTDDQLKAYAFLLKKGVSPLQQITLEFTNDASAYENDEDRDLYIQSIQLDQTFIPSRSPFAYYDFGKIDGSKTERVFDSRAGSSAEVLIAEGIPAHLIHTIDAPRVSINKTYTTAEAVAKWLKEEDDNLRKINLITESTHARRSWMLYKKAIPKPVEVGVIASIRNPNIADNWWKSNGNRRYVVSQTVKFWYAVATYLFV